MIIDDVTTGCNDSGLSARGSEPRGAPSRGVRASGPLGIVTKTYSPEEPRGLQPDAVDPDTGEITDPSPQSARANRWALKSVVNRLLPGAKTSKCMVLRAPIPGYGLSDIDVCKGHTHNKAFYQGLLACGRVWTCPVCAAKIAERRRQELKEAIDAASNMMLHVHFVTLTVPHGVGDDIKILNDRLSKALNRLSQGKYSVKGQLKAISPESEILGYIRAFEVTHGENGFHPHYHLLVFTNEHVTSSFLQYVYSKAWKRACRLSDLPEPSLEHGCTVQDGQFAAKYARRLPHRGAFSAPFWMVMIPITPLNAPLPSSGSTPPLSMVAVSSTGRMACALSWLCPMSDLMKSLLPLRRMNGHPCWPPSPLNSGRLSDPASRRLTSSLLQSLPRLFSMK